MSQRNVVAAEIQSLLEQMQALALNGERLAAASRMVSAAHFRAMQTAISMVAGELDQKGLLDRPKPQPEKAQSEAPA